MVYRKREEMLNEIQNKRQELLKSGAEKGIDHKDTLTISKQLDIYIYEFQKHEYS